MHRLGCRIAEQRNSPLAGILRDGIEGVPELSRGGLRGHLCDARRARLLLSEHLEGGRPQCAAVVIDYEDDAIVAIVVCRCGKLGVGAEEGGFLIL
jgi:hypothetical protein